MRPRTVVSLFAATVSCFTVGCSGDDLVGPTPGQLRITTATGAAAADPDGYTLSIDGGDPTRVAANETVVLGAAAGAHTVELGDVAPNCALAGVGRRNVTVPPGEVADVVFSVSCGPSAGDLIVTTATAGSSPDPDGYAVRIDDRPPQPIGVSGSVTISGLPPGVHEVELQGAAANCGVLGDNPVTVETVDGEPGLVEFRLACSAGVERWAPLPSGTRADFTSVWSAGDGSAVVCGERDINRGVEGVILRYEGGRWTTQLREPDLRPRGLWGAAPGDIYAVGYGFFASVTRILHYDGAQWSSVLDLGPQNGEDLAFESLWGSASDDVFAVGSAFDGPLGRSLIYHYDGTAWGRMAVDGPVTPVLSDVWGTSSTDVYAVGRDQVADPSTGVILHYDGVTWKPVLEVERLTLNAVWASSPTDVFAAGFQVEERGDEFLVSGAIWHYDGSGWSPLALPDAGVLHEIWGTSAGDVYAVGDDGLILRYDGARWTATTEGSSTLLGVWGSGPGELVAAGTDGAILRGTP